MKTINELSKKELASLSEVQVDAYIDIELANQNITKPLNIQVDYPDYVKVGDSLPEKDVEVYEVDGYTFPNMETAQKLASFVGTLPQIKQNYDYYTDESVYYVSDSFYNIPQVNIKKMYSEAKYLATKETIKQVKAKNNKSKQDKEEIVNEVVNYDAIDRVRYEIRNKVRGALQFFAEAQKIASEYPKFFSITNDEDKSYQTLFTVYNIQDEEMKDEVKNQVKSLNETQE